MKPFKSILGSSKSKKQTGPTYEDPSESYSGVSVSSKNSAKSSSSRGGPDKHQAKEEIEFFLKADKNLLLARLEELAVEDDQDLSHKKSKRSPKTKKSTTISKGRNESNASALQRAMAEGHI